jgi:hypothetical protein
LSFRLVAVHCRDAAAISADGFQARTQRRKENVMSKLTIKNVLALGVAGAITLGAASPTMALPLGSNGETVKQSAPDSATQVRWHRGWGWGVGLGAFALGAAVASGYPYGYGPYYGPDYYGPTYYGSYDPYYYGGHCWRRWGRVYCNY